MDAVEFLKTIDRMCKNSVRCEECGIHGFGYCGKGFKHKDVVKVVEKWAKEHPTKTNKEKFKEVFGEDELIDGITPPYMPYESIKGMPGEWWNREYEGK